MTSINGYSRKIYVNFVSFRYIVYSTVDAHIVTDIISLVSNKIPFDTGASFQESNSATTLIFDNVINNFEPVAFSPQEIR